MESYRVEMQATQALILPDADGKISPIPVGGGGHKPEPELEQLSRIIKNFNDLFGNIGWKDEDKIRNEIFFEIPKKVADDTTYCNAMQHSDKQNARIECDKALLKVVLELLKDHTELYAQFSDNPSFKQWISDAVFSITYQQKDANQPIQQ